MRVKLRYILLFFLVFFLVIIYFGYDFESYLLKIICASLVIFESIYITYSVRNNKCGFIMMLVITYEIYSIIISRYLCYKTSDSIVARYDANVTEQIYGVAICILLVWMTLFLFVMCTNKYNVENVVTARPQGYTNVFIGMVCFLATILILVFKFDFSVLGSGHRGGVSAAFEYAIIFFALGYYYAANNRWIRYALNVALVVYTIVALLAGERIGVVQMMFVPFLLYYGTKISNKWLLVIIVVGIVGMSIVSNYRSSFYGNEFSISKAITALLDSKMAFDGADHGFYTSLTMLLMSIEDEWTYRFTQGINYLLCIVLGDNSWLQRYTYQYYPHTYGGFAPFISYYYFGWIGIFLSSVIIGKILSRACRFINNKHLVKQADYYGLLLVIMSSTTFRWFAYSYILLFRMLFFYTIIFLFFNFIDSLKRRT